MKTAELIGPALDWAVGIAEGMDVEVFQYGGKPAIRFEYKIWNPDSNWSQGGPIIEREKIRAVPYSVNGTGWFASIGALNFKQDGPTPLIAAMRCFCASKLGDEIKIPDELT